MEKKAKFSHSLRQLKKSFNSPWPWEVINLTSQEYSKNKNLIISEVNKKFKKKKVFKVIKFIVLDKQGDKSLPRYIFELLKAIPSTNAVILSSSFWLHPRGCHLAQRWKRRPFILEVTKNMRKDKKIKFIDQIKLYKNFFLCLTEN